MKSAFRKITVQKKNDSGLMLAVIVCSAISVLMIYSISYNQVLDGVSIDDYKTQLVSIFIGIFTSIVISLIDYKKNRKAMVYIYTDSDGACTSDVYKSRIQASRS